MREHYRRVWERSWPRARLKPWRAIVPPCLTQKDHYRSLRHFWRELVDRATLGACESGPADRKSSLRSTPAFRARRCFPARLHKRAACSRAAHLGRKKPRDMPLHTLIQVREIVVPAVLVLVLVSFLVLVFRRSV
jgi:hypothetical protein